MNNKNNDILQIQYIKNIPQYIQKSQEWLNQRKGKLTSSDAATALGINPYEPPEKLLFKKCGISEPFVGNIATKHGERYESEAIDLYCKLTNKVNFEFGLIDYNALNPIRKRFDKVSFSLDFIAGSPDGIAMDISEDDDREELILLEVKCPLRRKIVHGKIPEYYYPQVQLNMAILDINKADFIEYIPAGVEPLYLKEAELNIVRVHRDHEWFSKNVECLYEFWNNVLHWRDRGIINHESYDKFMKKMKNL